MEEKGKNSYTEPENMSDSYEKEVAVSKIMIDGKEYTLKVYPPSTKDNQLGAKKVSWKDLPDRSPSQAAYEGNGPNLDGESSHMPPTTKEHDHLMRKFGHEVVSRRD